MNHSLYKTFISPYQARSLKSTRYQAALKYVVVLIIIVPLLFLIFQSFVVYFLSHVVILFFFPIFVWIYLKTDEVTDFKLDIIKVCVILTFYCSYLLMLAWVMIRLFRPIFAPEFVLLNLGYNLALIMITIIVTAIFFRRRYGRNQNRQSAEKENISH